MIRYIESKNLFNSAADALVNPVNCKGTMGKGIALEFKKRFPECVPPYLLACSNRRLAPGVLLLVRLTVLPDLFGITRPAVILFPTKVHWKDRSRVEWIEQGLECLRDRYQEWGLKSIAMPQVGCGLGGLEWETVRPLIEQYFADEPVDIEVYLTAVQDYGERSMPKPSKASGGNKS